MDTNRKTLVVAALILVLSLVAFNLNIGDLSGRAVNKGSSLASISVTPSTITCKEYGGSAAFSVSVAPGSAQIRKNLNIEDDRGYKQGSFVYGASSTIGPNVGPKVLRMSCEEGCFTLTATSTKGVTVATSNPFCVK